MAPRTGCQVNGTIQVGDGLPVPINRLDASGQPIGRWEWRFHRNGGPVRDGKVTKHYFIAITEFPAGWGWGQEVWGEKSVSPLMTVYSENDSPTYEVGRFHNTSPEYAGIRHGVWILFRHGKPRSIRCFAEEQWVGHWYELDRHGRITQHIQYDNERPNKLLSKKVYEARDERPYLPYDMANTVAEAQEHTCQKTPR